MTSWRRASLRRLHLEHRGERSERTGQPDDLRDAGRVRFHAARDPLDRRRLRARRRRGRSGDGARPCGAVAEAGLYISTVTGWSSRPSRSPTRAGARCRWDRGLYYARPDFAGRPSVYRPARRRRPRTSSATPTRRQTACGPRRHNWRTTKSMWRRAPRSHEHEPVRPCGERVPADGRRTYRRFRLLPRYRQGRRPADGATGRQMRQDTGARPSLSYGARFDARSFELADGETHDDSAISVNAGRDPDRHAGAEHRGGIDLGRLRAQRSRADLGAPWRLRRPVASRGTSGRLSLRDRGPLRQLDPSAPPEAQDAARRTQPVRRDLSAARS